MFCHWVSSVLLAPGSGLKRAASGYEAQRSGSFLTASLEGPHGPRQWLLLWEVSRPSRPKALPPWVPSRFCSERSSVDLDVGLRKGGCFSGKEGDTGKMGVAVTYSWCC